MRQGRGRRWIAGIVAGFAMLGIAFAFSKRTLQGVKVLHVGDSHVGGLQGPMERLVRASGGTYEAVFRNGISTGRAIDAGWENAIESARPDVVIVTLGTNDATALELEVTFVRRFIDLIHTAAPRASIVWWGPPSLLRSDIADAPPLIAEAQRSAIAQQGANFVDSQEFVADGQDGVHFTAFGYGQWAEGNLRKTFRVR